MKDDITISKKVFDNIIRRLIESNTKFDAVLIVRDVLKVSLSEAKKYIDEINADKDMYELEQKTYRPY